MTGINEKELLPIIRSAVTGNINRVNAFIEAITPILTKFFLSGLATDGYHGWAYNLTLINEQSDSLEYSDTSSWTVAPDGNDDYSFLLSSKVVIRLHFHSFLWNF